MSVWRVNGDFICATTLFFFFYKAKIYGGARHKLVWAPACTNIFILFVKSQPFIFCCPKYWFSYVILRWNRNHHVLEYLLLESSFIIPLTTAVAEKTLSAIFKNVLQNRMRLMVKWLFSYLYTENFFEWIMQYFWF